MPFETSWFLEGRVIYVKAIGAIQDHELEVLDADMIEMLDTAEVSVHMIYDSAEQTAPPRLEALGKMQSSRHARYGWFVMCNNQNKAVNLAGVYYGNNANLKTRILGSLEETLDFLNEIDVTLPPLREAAPASDVNPEAELG